MSLKIDYGYDVSWLSELRQVSVLFINLDPEVEDEQAVSNGGGGGGGGGSGGGREEKLLQTSFQAIYPSLVKFDGEQSNS